MSYRPDWEVTIRANLPVLTMRCRGTLTEACMATGSMIENHVANSAAVLEYLSGLGEVFPGSDPKEVAKFLGYRHGEIDTSNPWVVRDFIGELMVPVFRLRDEAVMAQLLVHDESGPYVRSVIDRAMKVGEAMDRLYLAWFEAVSAPYQERLPAKREFLAKEWSKVLGQYDYTVFDIDPSGYCLSRRSWAAAFPNEVALLQGRLTELRCAIYGTPQVQHYLDAFIRALGVRDVSKLEAAWAEVDRRWIEIPPDAPFVPVHGMENYEHPYGISPEFRLAWRVTGMEEAKLIKGYRDAALAIIDRRATGLKASAEAARAKLSRLDVGVFYSVVEGGGCLVRRLAGQVVPNRQDILTEGGKVFIANRESGSSGTRLYQDKARTYLTSETAAVLLPYVTDENMVKHTLGHECMHPIGCSPEIDAALGVTRDLLEEAKASMGGFLIGLAVNGSHESLKDTAAIAVARIIRFMATSILEDQGFAPYVRENLVVLRTMLDASVLRLTESGIEVDTDEKSLLSWIGHVDKFVSDLLDAYAAHDCARIKEMRDYYCGASEHGATVAMRAIIAWANRV